MGRWCIESNAVSLLSSHGVMLEVSVSLMSEGPILLIDIVFIRKSRKSILYNQVPCVNVFFECIGCSCIYTCTCRVIPSRLSGVRFLPNLQIPR